MLKQFTDFGELDNGLPHALHNFILYDVEGNVLCRPIWDYDWQEYY